MITDLPVVKCQKIDRCWELKFHEFRLRFNRCTWKISHITARDIVEPTIVDNVSRGYMQDFSRTRVKCHHNLFFCHFFLLSLAAGHFSRFGTFLDVSPKIIIMIIKMAISFNKSTNSDVKVHATAYHKCSKSRSAKCKAIITMTLFKKSNAGSTTLLPSPALSVRHAFRWI